MFQLLLVDDEKDVLGAMETAISWEKYGVQLAGICTNALEALEFMRKTPLDLVVTDVKMPVVSGIEMIRQAREMGISAEFIVLSGFDEFEYAQSAMSLGVRYYLLKPCSEEELGDALMRAQKDCVHRREAAQALHTRDENQKVGHSQEKEHFVDEIVDYINTHLDDDRLSLKWVSNNLVYRNEDYVGKAFSARMGEFFLSYLNRRRIEKAKELLDQPGENKMYTVADQIGLGHNPRYFSKLF